MASRDLLCPSAQPTLPDAHAIGLVDHTMDEPEVAYLERPLPVTPELLESTAPVRPTEVFRFAAPCQTDKCGHWDGTDCGLVARVTQLLPVVSLVLPRCNVRGDCRWYHQSGRSACMRCPQVLTQNEDPSDSMRTAAAPPARGG